MTIRSEFVLASRYGELEPPIDTVFIHIKEHRAYLKSCQNVLKLGFQGKMCIHPEQVAVTNKTFTPSNEEVVWSKRVISEVERAEAEGVAAIQVDGYFVDYPIVEKAHRIVGMANLLKELNSPS